MRRSSIAIPGSGMLSDPVAIRIAPVSTSWPPGAPVSSATRPGAAMRALPLSQSTLFLRNRNSTPRVRVPTTLSLRAIIAARSSPTSPTLTPCSARACRASTNFSDDCSSAFDGMQPILRQVPPSVARESTQAVRMPSWAARIAATYRRSGADHDDVVALGHCRHQIRCPGESRDPLVRRRSGWNGPRLATTSAGAEGPRGCGFNNYGHVRQSSRTAAARGPRRIP